MQEDKTTPLIEEHRKLKAKLVPFAGYLMPVLYTNLIEEHQAVRTSAGIFDVAHMGLIEVTGTESMDFIQHLTVNDLRRCAEYQAQYNMVCNAQGGILDDIIVYRLPDKYLIIVNASNVDKIFSWFSHYQSKYQIALCLASELCSVAVQGPLANGYVSNIFGSDCAQLKPFRFLSTTFTGKEVIIARTGYTGEDGFEMILPASLLVKVWQLFIKAGVQPCGLGCRDTLRLEAGLPLYGHELSESISPLMTNHAWAVKLDKGDFIGRAALVKQFEQGVTNKLCGIAMLDRAIPREGAEVAGGGYITSGTFSPSLNRPIAMAYLPTNFDSDIQVIIRNTPHPAELVPLPFYRKIQRTT